MELKHVANADRRERTQTLVTFPKKQSNTTVPTAPANRQLVADLLDTVGEEGNKSTTPLATRHGLVSKSTLS